jgi:site-specific DNA-methyltransferase (adenine-specific)
MRELKTNKVYYGDCLELMPKYIPNNSIDLILADLPFGTTKCKWDSIIPFKPLWAEYKRIIKPNGAIILNAQSPFDKTLGASNLPMLRYEWVWEKTAATGHLNAKKMPMKAHEVLLVFYKKLPIYNPQKTKDHVRKVSTVSHKRMQKDSEVYNPNTGVVGYDSTERYPRSVLKFKSDKQLLNLHPTQKPIKLSEYMIKTYTNKGDVVLDNCSGSGTNGKAAKNLERKYIMMEKTPKYFFISLKRVA